MTLLENPLFLMQRFHLLRRFRGRITTQDEQLRCRKLNRGHLEINPENESEVRFLYYLIL